MVMVNERIAGHTSIDQESPVGDIDEEIGEDVPELE